MVYYGVAPTRSLLALPLLVALLAALAAGFGILTSALNVKYRDIRFALPFLIQLWFFASPIIYPVKMVPERWRWVMALNPMTGIIEGFRAALFGDKGVEWRALGVSAATCAALLVCAAYVFRRMERDFADVV
jgi:lipopolysaccharide transport system permease protein